MKCIYTWSQQRIQWYINTLSLFYKKQYTTLKQYNTIKGTKTHSNIYCTLHRDDTIYSKLNTQSGPVHLSCPPECRRLSVAAGKLAARTDTWKFVTCYYTWVAAGHSVVVKYFYERPFAVPVPKCALKHCVQPRCWRDRTARPVQNVNWYSRLAQREHDTKVYITCTIKMIYIVVGKLLCYTLLQDCNHDHTWSIAIAHLQ